MDSNGLGRSLGSLLTRARFRRFFLALLVIPPLATTLAPVVGVFNLDASVAVMVGAVLVLTALLIEAQAEALARSRELRSYRNDDEALPDLVQFVETERPTSADLIEYSALGAIRLITKLSEVGTTRQIRLLVASPEAAISTYQRDYRLAEALRALAYRVPADRARYIGLQIKCYSAIASVRGRLLNGHFLVMGWYSYDDRGQADRDGAQMAGGSNALIGVNTNEPVGQRVGETFSRVFDNLWCTASQLDEAWEPYRARVPELPDAEWLKAVRALE